MTSLHETFKRYGLAELRLFTPTDLRMICETDQLMMMYENLEKMMIELCPIVSVPEHRDFAVVCGDQLSAARVRSGMRMYGWEHTHSCIGLLTMSCYSNFRF